VGDFFVEPPATPVVSAAKAVKGGGNPDPTDTGEGGPIGSGLSIVFGPVVVVGGAALGLKGGGNVDPTDTGEGPPKNAIKKT
jgi:hypothetical protein